MDKKQDKKIKQFMKEKQDIKIKQFMKEYIEFKEIFMIEMLNKYSQSTTKDSTIINFFQLYKNG